MHADALKDFSVQESDPRVLARIGEVVAEGGGRIRVRWCGGGESWEEPDRLFVASADDEGYHVGPSPPSHSPKQSDRECPVQGSVVWSSSNTSDCQDLPPCNLSKWDSISILDPSYRLPAWSLLSA